MAEQSLDIYMPSNPKDAKQIADVIDDLSDMMTMIEAKQDAIKGQKKALKDDWGYSLSDINTMIKLRHQRKADEYFGRQRDLEELYDMLFPSKD